VIDDGDGRDLAQRGLHLPKTSKLTYTARFGFDKSGSLNSVAIVLEGGAEKAFVANEARSELLDRLKDKYGAPSELKDEAIPGIDGFGAGKKRVWEWRFPETVITLTFADHVNPKNNWIVLG